MTLTVNIKKKLEHFQLAVNFHAENEVVALLGQSGCGKSLTLKCIAGLETPDSGQIILNGRVLFDSNKQINVPVRERRIGYLFQDYALFPNMTVEANIGISLPKKERQQQVTHLIETFKLTGLETAYPHSLSGGQQQRVALARMLASSPEVILLDEPFSALDEHLKWQLEEELLGLLDSYQRTTLFVSHNRHEVFRLSQKIGIMDQGKLQKIGTKHQVFQKPQTKAAALLTGCKNISPISQIDPQRWHCSAWHYELILPAHLLQESFAFIGIRAHDLIIKKTTGRGAYEIKRIIEGVFDYTYVIKPLETSPADTTCLLHAEQPKTSGEHFQLGEVVDLSFPIASLMVLQ